MRKKQKNKEEENYAHRSINLKIDPGKLSKEKSEKLDEDIEKYSKLTDIGVNEYVNLSDQKLETQNEKAKELRKKLYVPGITSGTFVDLAIGKSGAQSYVRQQRDTAISDILHKDAEVKKIEEDNPNLIKLNSVHFNSIRPTTGICTMCGRDGKIVRRSNEPVYKNEQLCEVCEVYFFDWVEPLKNIKRKHILKNYHFCKQILPKYKFSNLFLKYISRINRPVVPYEGTVSNKFKIKGGQLHIDWDKKIATFKLSSLEEISVDFIGEYYYENFPIYGMDSENLKFKKLVTEHIEKERYAWLIRKTKNEKSEYYISIPTRYPMIKKEKLEGCILVSHRRILIYANGKAKFIELYNPYIKKRIYGTKQKDINAQNKELRICDWNRIPKKNHKFLYSLKNKLGFDWINEHDIIVTKSEDGNKVSVIDEKDKSKVIEISLNRDSKIAELKSGNISKTLYVIDEKISLDGKHNNYSSTDLYIEPKINMPKKYSGGNLIRHTKHKSKEVARQTVEEAKKIITPEGSILVIDYTNLHTQKESIIPMVTLNGQIINMLKYDSIYGGLIPWGNLKKLTCPICHTQLQERDRADKRLFIRDIFLSKWNSWICEEEGCNKKINNALIGVAKHIMGSDIQKLMKNVSKKEKEKEINESIRDSITDSKLNQHEHNLINIREPNYNAIAKSIEIKE